MNKTVVVLINLGTPDSPSTSDVRKYLFQFLNDKRVIDIPWLLRKILVNLIIVPFRAPKSAMLYQKLWTKDGSPLVIYGKKAKDLLQESLGDEYSVHIAMRYQNPGIPEVLEQVRLENPKKLICIPMYPHYASSSSGSTVEEVMRVLKKWYVIPDLRITGQFYDHSGYIDTIVDNAKKHDLSNFEHFVFSYHGLPERQVDKVYDEGPCSDKHCESEITHENLHCYKATCYATTRLIAAKLNLKEEQYTVSFQSRLDKNWLEPFSDFVVEDLAKKGMKKVLVFSPAFVSDCLETTIEIKDEYEEIFHEHGGKHLELVESLNDHPKWIATLKDIVLNG
ncbi:MAG: ferrochelatase [Salibacteraceae bacterium]|jgi:ferrochelatase